MKPSGRNASLRPSRTHIRRTDPVKVTGRSAKAST